MGNISVIARRMPDGTVQYGWSGNQGHFNTVGRRLLAWYDTPERVDYLFALGQLERLWAPYSEREPVGGHQTRLTGRAHWTGRSEREIFSRIAFVDHGYFYDADHTWYYVHPGPFRIKLPARLLEHCMWPLSPGESVFADETACPFLRVTEDRIVETIFGEQYRPMLLEHGATLPTLRQLKQALDGSDSPLYDLWQTGICSLFDDWVVVRPDESGTWAGEILMRPSEETHLETVFW